MHIISLSKLKLFWAKHPNCEPNLRYWYKISTEHQWRNLNNVRACFPSADLVGNLTVFNIGGNQYRLITYIDYEHSKVFIRDVLTHAEYNKDKWKKDNWYKK